MEECNCNQTEQFCKIVGRAVLTLNPDLLTDNTVHSLQHSGYRKIVVIHDARKLPRVEQKHEMEVFGKMVPFLHTVIHRNLELNGVSVIEESVIMHPTDVIQWTTFSHLPYKVEADVIIEAEEVAS